MDRDMIWISNISYGGWCGWCGWWMGIRDKGFSQSSGIMLTHVAQGCLAVWTVWHSSDSSSSPPVSKSIIVN